jgi:hypothetical protein
LIHGKLFGILLIVTGIWLIILYGLDYGMGDESRLEHGWALLPIGLIHLILGVGIELYESHKKELIQTTIGDHLR